MYAAFMRLNRLSFALLLPALEIAVWLVLVPTQTGLVYWRLTHGMPASALRDRLPFQTDRALVMNLPSMPASAKSPGLPVPKHPLFDLALFASTYPQGMRTTSINLPGMFGEMLVDLPTTWPDSWHPATLMLMSWRTIVLPFYCLPFWWFVGIGLDTASGHTRLPWGWLLVGTILFLLFSATLIMFVVMTITEQARDNAGLLLSGTGFWALAFGTFPIAWVIQRKRTKSAQLIAVGAEDNQALS